MRRAVMIAALCVVAGLPWLVRAQRAPPATHAASRPFARHPVNRAPCRSPWPATALQAQPS